MDLSANAKDAWFYLAYFMLGIYFHFCEKVFIYWQDLWERPSNLPPVTIKEFLRLSPVRECQQRLSSIGVIG